MTQGHLQSSAFHLVLNIAENSQNLSSGQFLSQSQCDKFLGLNFICLTVLLNANQGRERGPSKCEVLEYFQNTEKTTWIYYTEKKSNKL